MYYSQIMQDKFVDYILDKDYGYFLDLGAGTGGLRGHPISFFSNTYYLEKHRSWGGISIDYDSEYIRQAKEERTCNSICVDLLGCNINDVLLENEAPSEIDYLSFDIDDATEKVLGELDFNLYKFKVITFEHNIYHYENIPHWSTEQSRTNAKRLRLNSRTLFSSLGYELLCADVILDNYGAVEDWYVNKGILDERILSLKCDRKNCTQII